MKASTIFTFALSALAAAVQSQSIPETHEISVTLAVDNRYTLYINNQTFAGPTDVGGYAWQKIQTFNRTVTGPGPWLVAVEAVDYGVISGFISAVYLDGQPYTASGLVNNLFKLTNKQPAAGWNSDLSFNDASWGKNISYNCAAQKPTWGASWDSTFFKSTPGLTPQPMWYPSCAEINGKNFIRLVVDQKDLDCDSDAPAIKTAAPVKAANAVQTTTSKPPAAQTTKPASAPVAKAAAPATTAKPPAAQTTKPAAAPVAPVAKPAAQTTKPAAAPVAKAAAPATTAKPPAAQTTKPAAAPVAKPAAQTTKPAATPVAKAAAQTTKAAAQTTKPAAAPVAKPAAQTTKPAAAQTTKAAAQTTKPAAAPVAKPAAQTTKAAAQTTKPAASPIAKPAAQTTKPAAIPVINKAAVLPKTSSAPAAHTTKPASPALKKAPTSTSSHSLAPSHKSKKCHKKRH